MSTFEIKSRMYRNKITSCKFILACASCDFKEIPRKMEKHLIDQHVINKNNSCPWCLGEYIWPAKEKMHHWQHFEDCYESYKKLYCTSEVKKFNNDLQKNFWDKTVGECEVLFECPRCQKLILPKKMEDHFKKLHKELNVKKFCVFCNGKYEGKDVNHLTKCFDKQLILFSSNTTTTTSNNNNYENNTSNIIFDISPTCDEMNMFGRQKLPNLDERAYRHLFLPSSESIYHDDDLFSSPIDDIFSSDDEDSILPFDDILSDSILPDEDSSGGLLEFRKNPGELGSGECNQLQFQGNVEIARQCLSFYDRNYYKWYHIMVRAIAFNKFCEVLDKYCEDQADDEYNCNSNFFILPFWCWCDGGKHKNLLYRHHRHMILATSDASFMTKVWKKIVILKKNIHQPCKLSIRIKSPWHLVNTMNYVSNRRSRCNFSNESIFSSKDNHFCIGTSLPKCFKLCMACVTKNGFQHFFSERCGKYSVESFVDRVTREKNGKWVLLVKFLNDILKIREILPVAKTWKLDKNATTGEAFIYAPSGNKVFFEKRESNLQDDEWKQMQIENGNVFLDAVEEEYWTPPPSQQKIISLFKYFTEKQTKKVAEEMRHQIENLKSEENERLKSEITVYREEIKKLQEEVINLRSQIDNLKNQENERLKSEYKKLQEDYKKLLEDYKTLLGASKFNAENMYLGGQNINYNSDNPPKYNS